MHMHGVELKRETFRHASNNVALMDFVIHIIAQFLKKTFVLNKFMFLYVCYIQIYKYTYVNKCSICER